jgi:hypothetical protein
VDERQRQQLRQYIEHKSKHLGDLTVWETYFRGSYVGDVWRAPGRRYRWWTNSRRSTFSQGQVHLGFDNRLDASLDLMGYVVSEIKR